MAGKDTNEIVVGANGTVSVAPVGTTGPTSISDPLDAAFLDLGYISEDGVNFVDGKTTEGIPVWQLFYPARYIVTEKEASASFALRQWGDDQVVFAFGGGVIVEDTPGEYSYTPPDPGTIDERAMAIDWVDGTKNYRLIIPRGFVTENVETQLVRTAASDLPITFGIIGEEGSSPWYLQTDDPSFQPPLGS